ncbi:MAG: hypothetical protein Q7T96_03530 [Methylobacter sp.]|nr:hypothetical protein [Methylobacter sp.]
MNNLTVLRPQQIEEYLNATSSIVNKLLASSKLPKIKLSDNSIGVRKADLDTYILSLREFDRKNGIFFDMHGYPIDLETVDGYSCFGGLEGYIDHLEKTDQEQQTKKLATNEHPKNLLMTKLGGQCE